MQNSYWSRVTQQRLSRRRALVATGGTALGAAFLAACGGGDDNGGGGNGGLKDSSGLLSEVVDETKSVQRGGSNKFYLNSDQQNLDPTFTSLPNQSVTNMVYSQFWHYPGGNQKPSDGTIAGDFAESWEKSGDGLTYTIKLRQDYHFGTEPVVPGANGRVPDADDVLASWDHFKSQGTRRFDIINEVNPEAPVASISAPDKRTIVFKLASPSGIFEHLMSNTQAGNFFIMPREIKDQSVFDPRRTQLGTGPWQLSKYDTSIQMIYHANPGFPGDSRNIGKLPYMDEHVIAIVPEYAAQLAQFKNGQIYNMPVRAEDQIATKRDVPALEMIANDGTVAANQIASSGNRWFFGMLPESPFRDVRMRRAFSMSVDRDLYIDVTYNVDGFSALGLPVETRWDSSIPCNGWTGWWIDPKGADWAPYYKYDVAEAKKLISAAGYPNGLEYNARYPATGYPDTYFKGLERIIAMVSDAGLRAKINTVNFNSEWRPQLADARGKFEGVSFIVDSGGNEPANFLYLHYNVKGSLNHGYDPEQPSSPRGDSTLNDLTTKARLEADTTKRKDLVAQIQKYEAQQVWFPRFGGGATAFDLAWPAYRGRGVWQGSTSRNFATVWLDRNKAPFKA